MQRRSAPRTHPVTGETGSGTVLALSLVGGVTVAAVAKTKAQNAADFAALAAAGAALQGQDGCAAAADFAERGRTRLVACKLTSSGPFQDAIVTCALRVRLAGVRLEDKASARAGPTDPGEGGN